MTATPAPLGQALLDELEALERTVERLAARRRAQPVDPAAPSVTELQRFHDELASHALAARMLVSSGASEDSVAEVIRRAGALLGEDEARLRAVD